MSRLTLNVKENSVAGTFPSYNKPSVIGYFSLDSKRNYRSDLSQLKYIHISKDCDVNFNLNHGIRQAIKKDDYIEEKLDNVLKWMLQNSNNGVWVPADFVCYRGLLRMLMCTPYENSEGWIICATRWKGTIFLCDKETDEKRRQRERMTDREKQFMSWGYKFEQYMSSGKPDGRPNVKEPVNEREEMNVMFRTKLSNHRLLFGAEMDGVKSATEINSCSDLAQAEFIELKTSRQIETDRQNHNFKRFKIMKWWGQSFLVGISQIVCGFRDDRGMVHSLENFEVSKLPKMARDIWDPSTCMNFCERFLTFVSSVVVEEEGPDTVWKFEWRPREDVTAIKIPGLSEYSFLPPWFTAP